MKITPFICVFLIIASSYGETTDSLDGEWELFKETYSKVYDNETEELTRRQVWEKNLKYIVQHNVESEKGIHTFTVGMNKFGDMTGGEFKAAYSDTIRSKQSYRKYSREVHSYSTEQLPHSVDWRTKGFVSSIKDQGELGDASDYAAVGSLESVYAIQVSKKLVELSVQNLHECSSATYPDQAFEYVHKNNGIDTAEGYNHKVTRDIKCTNVWPNHIKSIFLFKCWKDGSCQFDPKLIGATCNGPVYVPKGDEQNLTASIANVGPVAVGIDASQLSFMFYTSGIYSDKNCNQKGIDHVVVAVGYGSADSGDFYILKNSWGESWGMNGYILLARNSNNMCGVATAAVYPSV